MQTKILVVSGVTWWKMNVVLDCFKETNSIQGTRRNDLNIISNSCGSEHVYFWEPILTRPITNLVVPPCGELRCWEVKWHLNEEERLRLIQKELQPMHVSQKKATSVQQSNFLELELSNSVMSCLLQWEYSEYSHHWEHSSRSWLTNYQGCGILCYMTWE